MGLHETQLCRHFSHKAVAPKHMKMRLKMNYRWTSIDKITNFRTSWMYSNWQQLLDFPSPMPYVQIKSPDGNYQIYYQQFPVDVEDLDGRPQVLLLMGLGGIHGLWKFQVDYLQTFCHVCAMDNRGTGYSGHPSGQARWTTKRMAEDALAVLDDLGWKKVHVIGISMGGMIAQELALAVPERVASLALLATYSSALLALPTVAAMIDLARSTGLLTTPGSRHQPSFNIFLWILRILNFDAL